MWREPCRVRVASLLAGSPPRTPARWGAVARPTHVTPALRCGPISQVTHVSFKPAERKNRIGCTVVADLPGKHLAEGGSHLVPVTAAAARNPDVRHGGMTVDDELAVGTVFVLAHLGPENGCVLQRGEATAHERAERTLDVEGRYPAPVRGIELRASRVIGHLESAVQVAGDAVNEMVAEIDPHRHARLEKPFVPRRSAEIEDLLPCRSHTPANHV